MYGKDENILDYQISQDFPTKIVDFSEYGFRNVGKMLKLEKTSRKLEVRRKSVLAWSQNKQGVEHESPEGHEVGVGPHLDGEARLLRLPGEVHGDEVVVPLVRPFQRVGLHARVELRPRPEGDPGKAARPCQDGAQTLLKSTVFGRYVLGDVFFCASRAPGP